MSKEPMLSVRDAHARVIAAFDRCRPRRSRSPTPPAACWPQPPQARLTQPPADLSAMDGYAVRAEDVPAAPTTLTLVGQAPAGGSYDHALKPGETVRIFTGGPLPMGADAIVIQEDTKADGDKITILEAPRIGRHIRKAGLDFSAGDAPLRGRPHAHDARRGAGGGDEPAVALGASQAARRHPLDRRRAGDAGRAGRPQPDRLLLGHRRGGPGARLGRRSDPVRHRARRARS